MTKIKTLADIRKANEEFRAKKAAEAPQEPIVKQPKRRKHLVVPEEEAPAQEESPIAEEQAAPAEEE